MAAKRDVGTRGHEAKQRGTGTGRREELLRAAFEFTEGNLSKTFTPEDLLMIAWTRDPMSWGLRNRETEHPDSERMRAEIDRAKVKGGMVGLGLFEKVRQRTYKLTPAGLVAASKIAAVKASARGLAERALADAIKDILSHPVFQAWLKDPGTPKHFRDAGHFWGVAPGTPATVITARVARVDQTINEAWQLLDSKGVEEIGERHGKLLYDRHDIQRAAEFQAMLRSRFARDLATLGAQVSGAGAVAS